MEEPPQGGLPLGWNSVFCHQGEKFLKKAPEHTRPESVISVKGKIMKIQRLAWLTDLHLERVEGQKKGIF